MIQDVKFPEDFSDLMKSLLGGLLQRNVPERLGCQGKGLVTKAHFIIFCYFNYHQLNIFWTFLCISGKKTKRFY